MVQMVMDDIGRGDPRWDTSEGFIRANFGNGGSAYYAIKNYYYGLFSFTKSMLLHTVSGTCVGLVCSGGGKNGEACTDDSQCDAPIDLLGGDFDWYAAEVTAGDFTDGVARTLVSDQHSGGFWQIHNYSSSQFPFETGWAIVMLRKTIIKPTPVCAVTAVPNPAEADQFITLDCSDSFHLDPNRSVVQWEWDLDDDGAFDDASGPVTTTSFPLPLGTHRVHCKVADAGDELDPEIRTDTCFVDVDVTIPPIAPTAEAGGPYLLCADKQPWFLDGTGSVNPDDGISEPGEPVDFIQSYAWELDGTPPPDVSGPQPDVTAFFTAAGIPDDHLVTLTVCDNTALSFPISGLGDLCHTDAAEVRVRDAADDECLDCRAIFSAVAAAPGVIEVQLGWRFLAGPTEITGYNVYRSTTAGGPYTLLASTASLEYLDTAFECPVDGSPIPLHYYVVRATVLNGDEICQTDEASDAPICEVCENLEPKSQGFWRRVCKKDHPSQPDRSILTPELCEDMNPDPNNSSCEKARTQCAAVQYNVLSDRLDGVCIVDATGANVYAAIAEAQALIAEGTNSSCKVAQGLCAGINEGEVSP
jgi:hypothetical protein